jgi:acetyltransferase-like isoleucine patch superfamily enzyme
MGADGGERRQRLRGALEAEDAVAAGWLAIGEHSYGNPSVVVYPGDKGEVRIGRYCSIADGTVFLPGGNHRLDWVSTYPLRAVLGLPGALEDGHPASKGDIEIGNEVWIGNEVMVLSGVRVGHGAAIGARAVVTADVRPYSLVAGNPAREVRRRFDDRTIEALLRVAWWDWPDDVVGARVDELNGTDVRGFIDRYDPSPRDRRGGSGRYWAEALSSRLAAVFGRR